MASAQALATTTVSLHPIDDCGGNAIQGWPATTNYTKIIRDGGIGEAIFAAQ
jgi:hypothetical protein